MNIQIFGTKKCNDTKKAERFFKERGIKYQFIDMKEKSKIKALLQELENAFLNDQVKTTVVDITRLGLVEITRMKVRKPLSAFCIKDSYE